MQTPTPLVAIVYPDEFRAAEVLASLRRLQSEYLIDLADAVYVTREKKDGKIKLHQSVNLTAAGAVSGAFWGTLVGMLFMMPFAGMAVGAATGALSGKLTDYGIDDNFIKSLSEKVQPGSSAIFMLIRSVTMDKVEPELAKFGGDVLYTNLSHDAQAELEKALHAGKSA